MSRAINLQVRGNGGTLGLRKLNEQGQHQTIHKPNQHNQIKRLNKHQLSTPQQLIQNVRSTNQPHARLLGPSKTHYHGSQKTRPGAN